MKYTIDEAVQFGLDAGSMLDDPQLRWLYELADRAPDGPAVEVGVYTGGSLVCWAASRLERGAIYAVDPFGPEPKWQRAYETYMDNLARVPFGGGITTLRERSVLASVLVPNDLAFIFIDGDHTITGIPGDLLAWVPRLKPGGIIVFHDYISKKPQNVVGCIVDGWQAGVQWLDLGMVGSAKAFQRPED